jgi:hypothetical protein
VREAGGGDWAIVMGLYLYLTWETTPAGIDIEVQLLHQIARWTRRKKIVINLLVMMAIASPPTCCDEGDYIDRT